MTDEEVRLGLKEYGMEPLNRVPDVLKSHRFGKDRRVRALILEWLRSMREIAGNLASQQLIELRAVVALLFVCSVMMIFTSRPPVPSIEPVAIQTSVAPTLIHQTVQQLMPVDGGTNKERHASINSERIHAQSLNNRDFISLSVGGVGSDRDPRDQAPAVGTGGPEGGPTSLFTIYDGSTLRRGEFTFSIAYTNYDRDPGNMDTRVVPVSFNVEANDHIELVFKTNGWRGIKIINEQKLSGFYLPNSQLFCRATLCSSQPIILTTFGPNVGTIASAAVFHTFNTQPFVPFPFVDGSVGEFGSMDGFEFGFPGFNAQLGPPMVPPNSGNVGPLANFPGIGSIQLTFTSAPAYLPDAPFVNRLYESNFTNMVAGAKIDFTGPNNPLRVSLIPVYREYWDKADDLSCFNQMQRGAGPGGEICDFRPIHVIDGRLSRYVNVSAHDGYWLNSNPKDPDDFVMLDRPDELLAGIGFDFPVNEHFQPVAEVRSTKYVGGRTPNAFENNPVEVLGGIKIYPRRWFGIGLAYRRHLSRQNMDHIDPVDFNIPVQKITNIDMVGRVLVVVPGISRTVTSQGFPIRFIWSEEPNSPFIGQFWIGRRNSRTPPPPANQPPVVSAVTPSTNSVLRPCQPGTSSSTCTTTGSKVILTADATDVDDDRLLYTWSVTGGRVSGKGSQVTWDLSGVTNGTYTATVEVNDGNQHTASGSATVTVADCMECVAPSVPPTRLTSAVNSQAKVVLPTSTPNPKSCDRSEREAICRNSRNSQQVPCCVSTRLCRRSEN